jgi:hypothetical protein
VPLQLSCRARPSIPTAEERDLKSLKCGFESHGGHVREVNKMPFRSEKQRKFLYAKHPEIAKRWTKKYGSKAIKRRLKKLNS